jgi:hypothetical protein
MSDGLRNKTIPLSRFKHLLKAALAPNNARFSFLEGRYISAVDPLFWGGGGDSLHCR